MARNIPVVLGMNQEKPQFPTPGLDNPRSVRPPGSRLPLIGQEAHEPLETARPSLQWAEHWHPAGDGVPGKHFGQTAEGGDEDDPGKIDTGARVPLRDGRGHGGAEALADDDDARWRHAGRADGEVDERGAVGDYTLLGGRAGRLAKATVVDGEDVITRGVGEGVEGWGAYGIREVTRVLLGGG
jgi:hypothetical protein